MSQDLYHSELEKNHNWNSLMNILDATFFQIAFAGIVPAVIIVAYLKHFTDNEVILNLPVFISNFTMSFCPFVMSFFSGRVKGKKRATTLFGLVQRLLLIPIGLIVFFLSNAKGLVIPVFLTVYILFYLVWGGGSIFWQELMGRVLAPSRFTSAMGIREAISRVMGFVSSLVVMAILARYAFPGNFTILFGMCFVFWTISLIWIIRMKEAPYDEVAVVNPLNHLKNILQLPVREKGFRWYMIFILFYYGYQFVGGLYTVTGIERFGSVIGQDRLTGLIGVMTVLSSSLFAFMVGKICEKIGNIWGFTFFGAINLLLPISMIFCQNYYLYLFLIFLSGIINVSWFLEFSMLMGFSIPEKRHEYIAVFSLMKMIPIVLYTNLGGFLANTFSSEIAFVVSSAFSVIALLILAFQSRVIFPGEKPE